MPSLDMQKGFFIPTVLIIVLILASLPAAYWIYTNKVNTSVSNENVRGVSSFNYMDSKPGLGISVISDSNTWDLYEYLCTSVEECTKSLDSGKLWGTVSGGKTDLHEVVVESSEEWKDYKYLKYFVKPGWSVTDRNFKVINANSIQNSKVYGISNLEITYNVVLTPISDIMSKFSKSATFSDAR